MLGEGGGGFSVRGRRLLLIEILHGLGCKSQDLRRLARCKIFCSNNW